MKTKIKIIYPTLAGGMEGYEKEIQDFIDPLDIIIDIQSHDSYTMIIYNGSNIMKTLDFLTAPPKIKRIMFNYAYPLGHLAYDGKWGEYKTLQEKMIKEINNII